MSSETPKRQKLIEAPLHGKRALVFGGTSGIGLAAAVELLELGAEVVCLSRNPNKDEAKAVAGLQLRECDVLNREEVGHVLAAHAPIDFLVICSTGGERAVGPFLKMDLDGFQGSFAKLWGYTNVVRLGAEHMSKDGSIALVSGSPARRSKPGLAAIASVGGAVEQFARAVAPELAPRRINVVSPGTIESPMFGSSGADRSDKLASMTRGNLIPRPGTCEEVAKAILFVLQNKFVTGTTVDVDGGWLLSSAF